MIRVRCINPNCSAPSKTFQWDETKYVDSDGGIAQPDEPGAIRIVVCCPYCQTEMGVWVKKARMKDSIVRDLSSKL